MVNSPSSTASIVLANEQETNNARNPEIARKLKAEIDEQLRLENEILDSLNSCPIPTGLLLDRLSNLNSEALGRATHSEFYNPDVVRAAVCISSTITVPRVQSQYASNERTRNWITNLHQIGAESVEGYALSGDLAKGQPATAAAKNFYVVKAPRNPSNAAELLHETFLALTIVNSFRADGIPNFACVYAYSKCSTPFMDSETKQITTWCNSLTQSVTYSLYENIWDNLGSMGDLCETCEADTFMQYYLQSCYATRYAYYKCGWTHYDYHADNAMIRNHSKIPFYIKYPCRNGWVWLLSPGGVTTVIDYGMSHVELSVRGKATHFGHCGHSAPLRQYGIYRDRAHPMHDMYKHLCMCLAQMARSGNTQCYDKIIPLLQYFNTADDPSQIIIDQSATYYYLPIDSETQRLNIDDWIDWIQDHYDCRSFIRTQQPMEESPILGCGPECLSLVNVLAETGVIGTIPNPTTFLELYDIVSHHMALFRQTSVASEKSYHKTYIIQIIDRFPFDIVSVYEIRRINDLFAQLEQPFNYFSYPIYTQDWFNGSVLTQMQRYVSSATKFFDAFQRIQLALDVVEFFTKDQTRINPKTKEAFAHYRVRLQVRTPWKQALVTHLWKQYYILFPRQRTPPASDREIAEVAKLERQTLTSDDHAKFKWYWITFSSLTVLLK
jgi:hypothetical protein